MAERQPRRSNALLVVAAFGVMALVGGATAFISFLDGSLAKRRAFPAGEAVCSTAADCMSKDLVVQARAAAAAELVADLGIWSLVTGVIGLGGVAITLVLNARAARAATDAAIAAQDSVRLSEQTSRIQLRAYLSAELVKAQGISANTEPKFSVNIHNIGSTPAIRVSIGTNIVYIPDLVNPESFSVPTANQVPRASLVLGPGRSIKHGSSSSVSLTTEGLVAWQAGGSAFFLVGCIIYDDVFGSTWETRFVHAYDRANVDGRYYEQGGHMS